MRRASRWNASVQRGNEVAVDQSGFLNGDRDRWPTLRTGPDFCKTTPYFPHIRTNRISWNYLPLVSITPKMLTLPWMLVLLLLAEGKR
jgi:hypothetical protein